MNATNFTRETLRFPQGDIRLGICVFLLILAACAGSSKPPDWVTGTKVAAYPDDQFLIGVGQGDSRAVAEDRAYAALARVFKVDIISESKDVETYSNLEHKGAVQTQRQLTVETLTKVSTAKLLENVKVADTWKDPQTGLHSALAVLNRAATRAMLSGRIAELDAAIEGHLEESRATVDKLLKLRELHRAISNLITREALNNDLRVVSGRAVTSQVSISGLTQELERFLHDSVVVAVAVGGDQADAVRQAIVETLVREGLPVSARLPGETGTVDLLIQGETRLWPADLPDPKFRYVRWCGDFTVVSPENGRILASIARSGREGHLNYREASHRALGVLKQEISSALVKSFAEQIYGDGSSSDSQPLPAACPRH